MTLFIFGILLGWSIAIIYSNYQDDQNETNTGGAWIALLLFIIWIFIGIGTGDINNAAQQVNPTVTPTFEGR